MDNNYWQMLCGKYDESVGAHVLNCSRQQQPATDQDLSNITTQHQLACLKPRERALASVDQCDQAPVSQVATRYVRAVEK